MLSEKLTFSLTSFVVCLMLAFVGTAMGDGDHHFSTSFTPGELMVDVSSTDHGGVEDIQIESGRTRASVYPIPIAAGPFDGLQDTARNNDPNATGPAIVFSIDFGKVVQLHDVTGDNVAPSGGALGIDDFIVEAYDDLNRSLGAVSLLGVDAKTGGANLADDLAILSFKTPRVTPVQDPGELPGQQFLLRIDNTALQNAYDVLRGGPFEIHILLFQLKHAAVVDASLAIRQDFLADDKATVAHSAGPKLLRVDLVEDDEGFAHYAKLDSTSAASAVDSGVPGVIAISRVDARSGISAVATGPFDVRIVLTEEPKEFTKDHIRVRNGIASDPVAILPIAASALTFADFPLLSYIVRGDGNANFTPESTTATPPADTLFPFPTGRDNMYHLYTVTITPTAPGTATFDDQAGFDGYVTVSVKNFDDKVIPSSDTNTYQALSEAELLADTLSGSAEAARDVRAQNGREVLSVRAQTAGVSKIAKPALQAYEKALPAGKVIPTGGYLIVANGTLAQAGIAGSPDKIVDKKRPGQNKYNVVEKFDPPYPGDDLENYFRNGATIQLAYKNIGGNPAGANADTGYAGATDAVVNAGDVIISEIMWGVDRGLREISVSSITESQWIELHNTTASDISIDDSEWILVYGTTPSATGAVVIDKVSNVPDPTTYWGAPGQSGTTIDTAVVTAGEGATQGVAAVNKPLVDLVSMSRVMGGTDGTAAASWARSDLPSANTIGNRVATPGAANKYVMPPLVTEEPVDEPPVVVPTPTPVATAADIAISEIMYSTGRGNLPQWIELHNMSASEVSLEGWNVEIENDGGSDLTITLGAITVGVGEKGSQGGQAVLLVSKNGRNSGMGAEEGDLRRVVNLKDLGVTGTLLSSTGFTITLSPPPAAGSSVRTDGDVAGGMDWDLPMMDDDRSSLIREKDADGTYKDGSMRMSWHPTSSTGRYGTYYGHPSDMGTPGYVKGGALPVELSMFYPARDKLTGQVVITWETQSELNNAGFYIKRSEQPNGTFVVVNPTMIPGAGTTAEKQSYTHTDTTAKPNVLYYYQIEDVSLDGKRATLTGAHRLRGHIGAAGKVTTIWGELKAQE